MPKVLIVFKVLDSPWDEDRDTQVIKVFAPTKKRSANNYIKKEKSENVGYDYWLESWEVE